MGSKPIKREDGQGSIVFRKDRKRRPYYAFAPARYELQLDGTQKLNRQLIGTFRKRSEAEAALNAFLQNPTDSYNISLSQLYDRWSGQAFAQISKSTQGNYKAAWLHLAPLHYARVRDLKTMDLQQIINAMADTVSASTLQKVKALMTQLWRYAAINDIVSKNYAEYVQLPKKEKAEKKPFSSADLKKIRASVDSVPWADVILLMCFTGWRIGELLQLTAADYDPEKRALIGGEKTDAGKNRVVPVPDEVLPILQHWLDKGGQTIICHSDGRPYTTDNWRKKCWKPAVKAMGVSQLTPHCTRHTYATICSAAGLRPEDLMRLMGHSSYEVTAEVYIQQDVDTLRKAVARLNSFVPSSSHDPAAAAAAPAPEDHPEGNPEIS